MLQNKECDAKNIEPQKHPISIPKTLYQAQLYIYHAHDLV